MYPWKVVGVETWENDEGDICVRLYLERTLIPEDGHDGSGIETAREFYKKKYVKYDPVMGHQIAIVRGRYGISDIVVVGKV